MVLGTSLSDETINRGPVCNTHSAHVKEPTATKELSLAKLSRKSHSNRETSTQAHRKKEEKNGWRRTMATSFPQGEQPEFHAEKSAVTINIPKYQNINEQRTEMKTKKLKEFD